MVVIPHDIVGLLPDDISLLPTKTSTRTSTRTSASTSTSHTVWSTFTVSTPIKTTLPSTPTVLPPSAVSEATDHASKTWQIIGIAIISVLFVATAITCAMFFDRLCRFIKDIVCCTSRPLVSEEFNPDGESRFSLPSDYKAESLPRARELPWNTQPSRRNDL